MLDKSNKEEHFVILVTGLPASGKTTLGRQLGKALKLPFLSRDIVKEAIFDSIERGDVVSPKTLGTSSANVVWTLLKDCPAGAIVETWINPSRGDSAPVGIILKQAGVQTVYEILCQCPGDLAADRYVNRQRNPVHRADRKVIQDIRDTAAFMKPLGLGPTLTVDTTVPVNIDRVLSWWSGLGQDKIGTHNSRSKVRNLN